MNFEYKKRSYSDGKQLSLTILRLCVRVIKKTKKVKALGEDKKIEYKKTEFESIECLKVLSEKLVWFLQQLLPTRFPEVK